MLGSQAPPGAAVGEVVGWCRGRPERRRRRHRLRHGRRDHGAGTGPPRRRRARARARASACPGRRRTGRRAAVFVERRYKPAETWYDGRGRPFAPGVHYVVGGSTKVYGASLPRFREHDFGAVEHHEGTSPAWPFGYADLEPYYAEAERIYRVHGDPGRGPDRAVAQLAVPAPGARATSPTSRTSPSGCGPKACTPAPMRWASTADPRAAASGARPATASRAGWARRATPRPAPSTRRWPGPGSGWRPGAGCDGSSRTAPAAGSTTWSPMAPTGRPPSGAAGSCWPPAP